MHFKIYCQNNKVYFNLKSAQYIRQCCVYFEEWTEYILAYTHIHIYWKAILVILVNVIVHDSIIIVAVVWIFKDHRPSGRYVGWHAGRGSIAVAVSATWPPGSVCLHNNK